MRSIGKEIVETATQHIWTMLLREQARHPYHLPPGGLVVVDKGDIAALIDAALSDKDQQIKALIDASEELAKDLFEANKELKIARDLGRLHRDAREEVFSDLQHARKQLVECMRGRPVQNLPKSPRDALYEQRFIVRAPNVTKEES